MRDLAKHKESVHIGLRCFWGDCGQVFPSTEFLAEHLRNHQLGESINDAPGQLICHWPGCNKVMSISGKKEMGRHIKRHNGAMRMKNE
ncbi:hypothetical protein F5Y11DRAFT_335581 [Daldinia sp. FL1419]|nr:hypothetical protein F5Y11DRAFT_335581 [Daldinia sp. FL1419]